MISLAKQYMSVPSPVSRSWGFHQAVKHMSRLAPATAQPTPRLRGPPPADAYTCAPLGRSVTTLSSSAINRKSLWQRFGPISVSDQSRSAMERGRLHPNPAPDLIADRISLAVVRLPGGEPPAGRRVRPLPAGPAVPTGS